MIPIFEPYFEGAERDFLLETIETGWISSQGRFIQEFEDAFASWNGAAHAVATSNCTTALHLALAAVGVGPGDEVICADLTFIAPVNMIALSGATPVLVDVDPVSWGMDPDQVAQKVSDRTKAIIVVHPFGHAADMDPIMAVAKRHGLRVIEDVAEAPGATYKGRMVGTFGDMACYSFFANKIMTTGEGGMVLCSDADLDKQLRIHRDHGMSREKRYHHVVIGFNYRMTNMQAAIGLAQLERLSSTLQQRQRQEDFYRERLSENKNILFRPKRDYGQTVHWMTTITLPERGQRDRLLEHMKANGIDGRQMVFPVHEAVPYQNTFDPLAFPIATDVSHRSLHLPSSLKLPEDDLNRICDCVLGWAETEL